MYAYAQSGAGGGGSNSLGGGPTQSSPHYHGHPGVTASTVGYMQNQPPSHHHHHLHHHHMPTSPGGTPLPSTLHTHSGSLGPSPSSSSHHMAVEMVHQAAAVPGVVGGMSGSPGLQLTELQAHSKRRRLFFLFSFLFLFLDKIISNC